MLLFFQVLDYLEVKQHFPSIEENATVALVTKFIYKQATKRGYYPFLNCEITAKQAIAIQNILKGHKVVGRMDYICHKILQ